uniref:UDP-gluconosyltransferase n=1 Tax=Trialeurodes vaporariorum TaxID=88556 RepID=A0A873P507_TRIVP|nr:UDP-gluconosyltransferase [Trialeurodes vaporariorum]
MKIQNASYFCCFVALSICTEIVLSARILFVLPFPGRSHYLFSKPLLEELAARGHQVTAYTTFKQEKPQRNYKAIQLNTSAFKTEFDFPSLRNMPAFTDVNEIWTTVAAVNEALHQGPELQELKRQPNDSYDLIIVQATFADESVLAFGHKFGVPVINMHPLMMDSSVARMAGAPHGMSYIPEYRYPHTDRMNFWQRVKNTAIGVYELIGGNVFQIPNQDGIMRRNFRYPGSENLPHIRDLIANISLHLVNTIPLFTYNRPYPPNVIEVAGINLKRLEKLPQDLQTFLDEATNGAIFFSFGSMLTPSAFSTEMKKVFVETMKSLTQYRIIWKWTDEIDNASGHILQRPWLPQPEILAHPNCKLFITHGGFNSLVEVMSIGKPVLGIPYFTDQFRNVAFYEQARVGLGVDLDNITVADFTEKINRIIQTSSFRENAKKISALYHDQPQTSLEKAVFWVEYVIRHKGAHHLKPASMTLPYYKYLLIDVILFFLFSLFLIIYICIRTVRKIICQFCLRSNKIKKSVNGNKKQN